MVFAGISLSWHEPWNSRFLHSAIHYDVWLQELGQGYRSKGGASAGRRWRGIASESSTQPLSPFPPPSTDAYMVLTPGEIGDTVTVWVRAVATQGGEATIGAFSAPYSCKRP